MTRAALCAALLLTGAVAAAADKETSDGGYYTTPQAVRGKQLFDRNCALCHSADVHAAPVSGRGFWLGKNRIVMNLAGRSIRKFPSVYYLFQRVRDTMPAWNADAVSIEDKLDIVAFLLRANGFPPGTARLTADVPAMKAMALDEPGFQRLFNGRDFTNFKFLLGMNCRPAPAGCGKTEPAPVYFVQGPEIVNTGKIFGYMYTEQKYLNFTLRLEYRYEPPLDWEGPDDLYGGNSGYFLFITEHAVFPKCIEIQGRNFDVLSVLGNDTAVKFIEDKDARRRALHPVGQWNTVEIFSKDGQVKSSLNGTLISTITQHEFTQPGHIGFQSSGGEIHWRNIRVRPE
jgi:mono/diheme cytochrome c family protein